MKPDEAALWRGARVGILGGTFDPPHRGHVQMADAARTTLSLDRVVFSAAPRPPHKTAVIPTPYAHRRAMLELALAGVDGVAISDLEPQDTPSYSVDLLRAARALGARDLYFVVGADSLSELATWKDPEEIVRACTLVVFPRGGERILLPVAGDASVVVMEVAVADVSSRAIRARIAAGESPGDDVAPEVADYISRHTLYRSG